MSVHPFRVEMAVHALMVMVDLHACVGTVLQVWRVRPTLMTVRHHRAWRVGVRASMLSVNTHVTACQDTPDCVVRPTSTNAHPIRVVMVVHALI